MPAEKSSAEFQTVLVPIANPETAPALLKLARSLLGSGEGRVVALVVVTDDARAEERRDLIQHTERLVSASQWRAGIEFEQATRTSPSVSRGVLDAALEFDADVVLLGVRQRRRGDVEVGPVVESVIATAAADVVVARIPPNSDVGLVQRRIVVPVDGSLQARAAVETALAIGHAEDAGVEVIHVQGSGMPKAAGHGVIASTIEGTGGEHKITPTVVVASDVARGILARSGADDLIVIGASSGGMLRHWLHAPVSTELLRHAPCPVLAVSRQPARNGMSRRLSRLRPKLTSMEQDSVVWHAQSFAGISVDYIVLIVVSSILASLGLLQNSAAVVIGAMLVAPLLGPLTAVSVGLVTAGLRLVRRAAVTLVVGSAVSVACAVMVGLLIPLEGATAEMMARGSPSLIDAGVALAAGVVGAYATARKDIPAALAGVAIAAALVPPVCTFGLGLAIGDFDLAWGALLLFAANIVSVALVGAAVFWWFGMRFERGAQLMRYASVLVIAVLSLVSVLVLLQTRQRATEEVVARRDLGALFPEFEVVDLVVEGSAPIEVVATLRGPGVVDPARVGVAERLLEEDVGGDIELSVVIQQVIRGE